MLMPNIKDMNKKQLKEYVNNNGFFQKFSANKITSDEAELVEFDSNAVDTGRKAPNGENVMVFSGIASQNYGKGNASRNGYKIDQNGWVFDNFLKNPQVLLQHNMEYGGIGSVMKFGRNKNGDLTCNFYVDLNTIKDENTKYQIQNGYITGVSTTHITEEFMLEENDTGTRYDLTAAEEKFGYRNVMMAMWGCSDVLTMVVTSAQMIELSLVTIGSNEEAIVSHNSINKFFEEKANALYKDKDKNEEKADIIKDFVKANGLDMQKLGMFLNEIGVDATKEEIVEIVAEIKEVETPEVVVETEVEATETNEIVEVEVVANEEVTETPAVEVKEEIVEAPVTSEVVEEAAPQVETPVEAVAENAPETNEVVTEEHTDIVPETVEQPASEIPAVEVEAEVAPVSVDENMLAALEERILGAAKDMLTDALRVVDKKIQDVLDKSNIQDEEKNAIVEVIGELANGLLAVKKAQKNTIVDSINQYKDTENSLRNPEKALSPLGKKLQDALNKAGL